MRYGRKTVELTGDFSDTQFVDEVIFPKDSFASGKVIGVAVRLDPTDSNASSATFYMACNQEGIDSIPAAENLVMETEAITLTADAVEASLQTTFDNIIDFYNGLVVGANVTATGAFKIFVTVHYAVGDR